MELAEHKKKKAEKMGQVKNDVDVNVALHGGRNLWIVTIA